MTSTQNLMAAIAVRKQIDNLESKLTKLLGSNSTNGAALIRKPMSQSARLKIAAAQRKRWARVRAGKK